MSEYKKIFIKDLGVTITGKTPSSDFPEDYGDQYLFVTPSDNFDSKFITKTQRYLSEIGANKLKSKILPPKSIMVTCIGSAMGKVAMNINYAVTNQQINSIISNDDEFDADYIYYLIKNNYLILRNAASGSTALPLLNKTDFDNLSIIVNSFKFKQQKIASVLSALDDKIELNNKINAELEAMAKTLYDYWFVQFEFPNADGKPYKSSGGKMVYNETLKREIPEGWEVKSLFECAKVQYGFPFSTEYFNENGNGIPVIRIRDILNNSISNYSTQDNIDEKYSIKEGDLLIGMDGNFHINYWTRHNCYLNQRIVMLKETILPNILLRYQVEPYIQLREKSVSRTTVGHLSDKDLKAINILVPTEPVLNMIKSLFDSKLKKIIVNSKQNQELAALRDWLLPMLMNGQVKVEEKDREGLNIAAETKNDYIVSEILDKEKEFDMWKNQVALVARGNINEKILRKIFDAIEEDEE